MTADTDEQDDDFRYSNLWQPLVTLDILIFTFSNYNQI